MPRKPTTSKSTLALPESPTQLCPSWPIPTSTVVVHSPFHPPPPLPNNQYSQRLSHYITHWSTRYYGLSLLTRCCLYQSLTTTTIFIRRSNQQQVPARRSNILGQNTNYSNVIQNHALKDRPCLVSSTLDNKPITILIDRGSSINLLDEQLYRLLSFVPPLQPIQFSVSGVDDRPLIALGLTSLPLAIDDNTFHVELAVSRNILFPVVLGINFLQRHGGIIRFLINHLYLSNSPTSQTSRPAYQPQSHLQHIHTTHAPTQAKPSTLAHHCSPPKTLSCH